MFPLLSCNSTKNLIGVWQIGNAPLERDMGVNDDVKLVEFLENRLLLAGIIGDKQSDDTGTWFHDKENNSLTTIEGKEETKFTTSILEKDILELKNPKITLYLLKIKDKFSKNTSADILKYYKPNSTQQSKEQKVKHS